MQKRLLTIVGIVIIALVLSVFLVLPSLLAPPAPTSVSFFKMQSASYATGSSIISENFTLKDSAVLSGAFVTNATATVMIQQSSFPSGSDECRGPTPSCYTTGNVNHATLDGTLQAGSYRVIVTFTNDTTVQTWFNVTAPFVATYQK
jgi:hypothetical protein